MALLATRGPDAVLRCFVISLALMLSAGVSLADGLCNFRAYSRAVLPDQVAIHAEPSAGSAILGPAPVEPPGTEFAEFGAEFHVVEMRDGWAKVTGATSFERTATGPDGWIDGRQIAFEAQTQIAFAAPDAGSERVWSGDNWPYPTAVLDCDGDWALIVFEDYEFVDVFENDEFVAVDRVVNGLVTGWVRGICAAQETSCEGKAGDGPP
jgi:hypothetical protein